MYVLLILGLILLYFVFKPRPNAQAVKQLIKGSAKWASDSRQDGNPLTSMVHSCYAVGYLSALKDIASPKEINRITAIDFDKFQEHIINSQEYSKNKLLEKCPQLKEETDLYLSNIIQNL